jgi:glutathione S-transferase
MVEYMSNHFGIPSAADNAEIVGINHRYSTREWATLVLSIDAAVQNTPFMHVDIANDEGEVVRGPTRAIQTVMRNASYMWLKSHTSQRNEAEERLRAVKPEPSKSTEYLERLIRRYYTIIHGQEPTDVTMADLLLDKFPDAVTSPLRARRRDWMEMGLPSLGVLRQYLEDSWQEYCRQKAPRIAIMQADDRSSRGAQQGAANLAQGALAEEDVLTHLQDRIIAIMRGSRGGASQKNGGRGGGGSGSGSSARMPDVEHVKNSPVYKAAQDHYGVQQICYRCLKPFQKLRACCSSTSSQTSRQYSSVVFATAKITDLNKNATEADHPNSKADWIIDSGAQASALDAGAPAAAHINWMRPTCRLTTAGGEELAVLGEAWVILTFDGGVKKVARIFKVQGLTVEAVLGTDVLFAKGRCSLDLRESTGRGVMRLGPGERIRVWTPENAIIEPAVIQAGMRSIQIRTIGRRTEMSRHIPVKIDRTPVLATLEEADVAGVIKPKRGEADVKVNGDLTREQREEIKKMLTENRDAFANNEDEVGIAKGFWVNIDVLDRNPVTSGKNRRVPVHLRDALEDHLRELERQNLIKRSNSPYCSGIVVVHKTDGSIRLCIDYKDLNAKTADDGFQLPIVEDQLNLLQGAQYFTKLDLFRGYHQLLLAPSAQAKTAFNANGVHYEYLVLPFGPKNGPAAFTRFVFEVLGEMQRQKKPVAIFFDDIIIGGKTFKEHTALVREVLERLKAFQVTVKSKKAEFAMSQISCLGYVLDRKGIHTDPAKVEAIANFPQPRDDEQLRSYLGTVNFYGWMIPKLQHVLRPLNQATERDPGAKKKPLVWTPELEKAFVTSKKMFVGEVLTYIPDFSKPFIVTTDASEAGVGGTLSQLDDQGNERPVAFYSKGLESAEFAASEAASIKTRELELYAFLLATRKWRSYLYGKRFKWLTDHKPLLWDEKNPTKKVTNWLAELKELDFEAVYVKGEENTAADALSRHAHLTTAPSQRVMAMRTFVGGKEDRNEILRKFHDAKGHQGGSATLRDLKTHGLYWPGMAGEVMRWCKTCDICQKMRSGRPEQVEDEPTSQATEPFSEVAMDLVQIDDYQMLVVECMFTRWAETTLLTDKSATGVYKAVCELLLDRYGVPDLIRTDNGNEFNCLGAASFELGYEWRRCSPHNPRSQGMVERANQSILNGIAKLRAESGYGLEDARRMATKLYNSRVHKATGFSPYRLVFGKEQNEPDLVLSQRRHNKVNLKSAASKYAAERAAKDREAFQAAQERDERQKADRQPIATGERFKVGDLVLVPQVNKTKTDPRRQGPYEVIQVRAGNVYRLKDVTNFRRSRLLYHHRKLTRYERRTDDAEGPARGEPDLQPAIQEYVAAPQTRREATVARGGGDRQELSEEIARALVNEQPMDLSSPLEGVQAVEAENETAVEEEAHGESQVEQDEAQEAQQVEPEAPAALEETALIPWVDQEEIRRKALGERKEAARGRRPDTDETLLRRSKRTNKGVPPLKYAIDLVKSMVAHMVRQKRQMENWAASHRPEKQLALRVMRRLAPLSWGEECRNTRSS